MGINIEKNKPIPEKGRRGKYPWPDMEIGDSFLAISRHAAFGSLFNYNKNMKAKRKKQIGIETKAEGNGCRVWRIK